MYILTVLIAIWWIFSLRSENAKLKGRLSEPQYRRFEELSHVRYGHVPYYPFLDYEKKSHKPYGIGLRVLDEMFGHDVLSANPDSSSWENMIDKLIGGDFDIIATPLFETQERSRKVAFSNPIFFADIGIYMRSKDVNGDRPFLH